MSEFDIEYYYLSDSEIKGEFDFEDAENKGFEDNEEDSRFYEAKCGDIFVSNSGKYTFVCEFCSGRYEDMGSFGDHLKDTHLDYDTEEAEAEPGTELKVGNGYPDEGEETNSKEVVEEEWQSNDHDLIETPTPADFEFIGSPTSADSTLVDSDLYCTLCDRQLKTKLAFSRHKNIHKCKLIAQYLSAQALVSSDFQSNSNKVKGEELQPYGHDLKKAPTPGDSTLKETSTPAVSTLLETPTPAGSDLCCKPCNRQFKTKLAFSRHKNIHKCKLIAQYLAKKALAWSDSPKQDLTAEVSTSRDSPIEDLAAEVSTDSPRTQTEVGQFFCSFCNRYFKTRQGFKDHSVSRHGDKIPEALRDDPSHRTCKFCHMKFDKVLERVRHEETHDEDKPFRCALCPKTFRLNSQRELHNHSHTGAHPYPCPHCPKAFTTQINRLQHIRRHFGIKRFTCEYCDKKFVTNVQRNIHIRIHTLEKPYQCEECGERFRVSGQLLMHKKRHSNIRDFKCDICEKSFFAKEDVKSHRISHFEDRPFECTECGKKFQRKKNLTAHQKLHMPEKKYECNICGKKFAQCAGLYSHRKTHGVTYLNT
ncbi:unnamed protein product [Hermetia illucens]|uniref:C2H2-type domain-containing protein n=1 Tax=Hermetia illucens TaxID=343691 RepID=A0A7R8UTR8_HERIL|nr:unnamed protein product [Hermetia illucens]